MLKGKTDSLFESDARGGSLRSSRGRERRRRRGSRRILPGQDAEGKAKSAAANAITFLMLILLNGPMR